MILLEQRSHLAHLYVLPRFAVVEGYEEHAFIPYTHIFDSELNQYAKTCEESLKDGEEDSNAVKLVPKEKRAEYIQSTVTKITTSEVSFVRHRRHTEQQPDQKATDDQSHGTTTEVSNAADSNLEKGEQGTVKLKSRLSKPTTGTHSGRSQQPLWKVDSASQQNHADHVHSHVHVNPTIVANPTNGHSGSHLHLANVQSLPTPPSSEPSNTPRDKTDFTCCNDCVSPSSRCCQATPTGTLTPKSNEDSQSLGQVASINAAVSAVGDDGGKLRTVGCATCMSPSETCCQASSAQPSAKPSIEDLNTLLHKTSLTGNAESQQAVALQTQVVPAENGCADCVAPNSSVCCSTLQPRSTLGDAGQGAPANYSIGQHQPGQGQTICQGGSNSKQTPAQSHEQDATETLRFKYLIFATGSRLPHPLIRLPMKKMDAKHWLKENQRIVKNATRVLVVGGGALGIRELL